MTAKEQGDQERNSIPQQAANGNTEKIMAPDLDTLSRYNGNKLLLSGYLRTIREGFSTLGRQEAVEKCNELMVKLAEDRFTLAVLGQFKRGKSSLMNAIIGREILPTGVLPLTSAITVLRFGAVERLIVHRSGSLFDRELPVSEIAEYVTEKENPGNIKKVERVYAELPLPFLRYGLEFVDTPGVGSSSAANTQTTYRFLPNCDAAIFVTAADAPMTNAEIEFLKSIQQYIRKLFFVVNKTDLITDPEITEVLEFTRQVIRDSTGSETDKVFALSSRLALEAHQSGNDEVYAKSGLGALEEALISFLTGEKFTVFLLSIVSGILQLIEDENRQEVFAPDKLQRRAEEIGKNTTGLPRDPFAAAIEIQGIRLSIEKSFQTGPAKNQDTPRPETEDPKAKSFNRMAGIKNTPANRGTARKAMNTGIAEDLQLEGCPICRHITDRASDFFADWQYRLVTEEEARESFAGELGFCPLHTWQLFALSSPYGVSVGYAPLAGEIANWLKANSRSGENNSLKELVRNPANCRVCQMQRTAEKEYIGRLIRELALPQTRQWYSRSHGLCLRHLGLVADTAGEELSQFIVSQASRYFLRYAEDMRSFALKQDALRRSLQNEDERNAYRRMVAGWVGERSVCAPWAQDGYV